MRTITLKQLEIYIALEKYTKEKGYSPSFDELAKLTNHKSKSTVYQMLKALQSKGYVSWEDGQSRTLRIIAKVSEEDRERIRPIIEYAF